MTHPVRVLAARLTGTRRGLADALESLPLVELWFRNNARALPRLDRLVVRCWHCGTWVRRQDSLRVRLRKDGWWRRCSMMVFPAVCRKCSKEADRKSVV